jgi:hypothetical protein
MPFLASQVVPEPSPPPPRTKNFAFASKRWEILAGAAGFLYVLSSLVSGVIYLILLSPSLSNDLWWPNYNLSGHHVYLIDATNSLLPTASAGPVDLLDPYAMLSKNYSTIASKTEFYATYARNLLT